MKSVRLAVLSVVVSVLVLSGHVIADFDHQTTPYNATFVPATAFGTMTITPYFSPYYSVVDVLALINGAQSTLDIGTPGWGSWIGCTNFNNNQDGCSISEMRNQEKFPVQAAVLNAAHRGVKVRILTNDYGVTSLKGKIDPLQLLAMASPNIQLRYYTSTTFFHAKYMAADNTVASVSSVNFSFTSIMENREAGLRLAGPAAGPLIQFMKSVFDADFNQAYPHVPNQQYSAADMKIITDPSPIPVPSVSKPSIPAYMPPIVSVTGTANVTVAASPDFARSTILDAVAQAQSSFQMFIYQVTDTQLCQRILALKNNGIKVTLLVSHKIYSYSDWKAAQQCYTTLYNAGMTIRETNSDFTYSHQKFWIVDGTDLWLSTGNWSPTDYPIEPPSVFPPANSTGWRDVNRDFTIHVGNNAAVIQQFTTLLQKDYATGSDWYPYNADYVHPSVRYGKDD
eukprot:comp13263_c0_seq1/m.18137 comp13263_c0_seq1/g.18137  ORF comp13263_c0_seq1/g.18137 comp13263_c0_seq1/m.18137 type:complete len:453 (+) comp13263_c0_seq1:44-1402(+)